jgi:hypothetical protein
MDGHSLTLSEYSAVSNVFHDVAVTEPRGHNSPTKMLMRPLVEQHRA